MTTHLARLDKPYSPTRETEDWMIPWVISELGIGKTKSKRAATKRDAAKKILISLLEYELTLVEPMIQLDEISATFSRPQEIMDEPYDDVAGNGVKIAKLEGLLRMYERLGREISQHLQKLKS